MSTYPRKYTSIDNKRASILSPSPPFSLSLFTSCSHMHTHSLHISFSFSLSLSLCYSVSHSLSGIHIRTHRSACLSLSHIHTDTYTQEDTFKGIHVHGNTRTHARTLGTTKWLFLNTSSFQKQTVTCFLFVIKGTLYFPLRKSHPTVQQHYPQPTAGGSLFLALIINVSLCHTPIIKIISPFNPPLTNRTSPRGGGKQAKWMVWFVLPYE